MTDKLKLFFCILLAVLPGYFLHATDFISDLEKDSSPVYQALQVKVGFHLGWDYPYSPGPELSLLFHEWIDLQVGAGIGLSGVRFGSGLRVYPLRHRKFSPVIGACYYINMGTEELELSIEEKEAIYTLPQNQAVIVSGGFRFRYGRGHYVLAGVGYSFAFDPQRSVYVSGSTDSSIRSIADALGTGGLSLHAGILLKLTKGHYRLR